MTDLGNDDLDVRLSSDVLEIRDEIIALRRDIHRHPELGFEERRTQQVVLERLGSLGIDAEPTAGTGAVGLIRGKQRGKVLLIRADMDALPIEEERDVPWRSENKGIMHACGHDAHTAMLIGTARILQQRGLERGAVKLMFQPAEEGAGGAVRMIEEGILKNPDVDAAIGFHVWSGYPVGQVMARPGPVAASVDGFKITVRGKGTHAATPEEGVDPVAITAQIITSAQALVTRGIGPRHRAVLSFTAVNGGSAFNVIPERVSVLGTYRTFDTEVRRQLRNDVENLARSIAESFRGTAQYESLTENLPVINDPTVTALVQKAASEVVGQDRLITPDPLMVGEDFGEVTDKIPGAFVWLGSGSDPATCHIGEEEVVDYPHHHPKFTIDERVLPIGVEIAVRTAKAYL